VTKRRKVDNNPSNRLPPDPSNQPDRSLQAAASQPTPSVTITQKAQDTLTVSLSDAQTLLPRPPDGAPPSSLPPALQVAPPGCMPFATPNYALQGLQQFVPAFMPPPFLPPPWPPQYFAPPVSAPQEQDTRDRKDSRRLHRPKPYDSERERTRRSDDKRKDSNRHGGQRRQPQLRQNQARSSHGSSRKTPKGKRTVTSGSSTTRSRGAVASSTRPVVLARRKPTAKPTRSGTSSAASIAAATSTTLPAPSRPVAAMPPPAPKPPPAPTPVARPVGNGSGVPTPGAPSPV
jgi:hypothetical protein